MGRGSFFGANLNEMGPNHGYAWRNLPCRGREKIETRGSSGGWRAGWGTAIGLRREILIRINALKGQGQIPSEDNGEKASKFIPYFDNVRMNARGALGDGMVFDACFGIMHPC
jgi:hypothetical protein